MELDEFSFSLAVADLEASKTFRENPSFSRNPVLNDPFFAKPQ